MTWEIVSEQKHMENIQELFVVKRKRIHFKRNVTLVGEISLSELLLRKILIIDNKKRYVHLGK